MKSRSENFYDRFTVIYPLVDIFLSGQKRKFFQAINDYPSGRLLEIGVGTGSHFKYYRHHQVTGIDTSRSMLKRALLHANGNIELRHMDGEALAFPPAFFDYVVLSHVIAVVTDPEKLLTEVHRVLKPNGKLFILNHVTPDNALKYIDRLFIHFSKILHFRSVFRISALQSLQRYSMLKETNAGWLSYFKVFIYEKKL